MSGFLSPERTPVCDSFSMSTNNPQEPVAGSRTLPGGENRDFIDWDYQMGLERKRRKDLFIRTLTVMVVILGFLGIVGLFLRHAGK